jgi:hypothetical protein
MGGVYTAVYMPFGNGQETGCVRISGLFPDHDRQDAGLGNRFAFFCTMFSFDGNLEDSRTRLFFFSFLQ